MSLSFFAALGFEEALTLVDFVFVPCDFDVVVLALDFETLDLALVALWVFELLRLLTCFISASVLLHLLVSDLECVGLSGLARGASGRAVSGRWLAESDPNTPGRVEGPTAWRPALTTDTCWREASLFKEEERDPPKLTKLELLDAELDVWELVRKVEKELEVALVTLEVMTWVVKVLPPPPPHPPARLLLSIFVSILSHKHCAKPSLKGTHGDYVSSIILTFISLLSSLRNSQSRRTLKSPIRAAQNAADPRQVLVAAPAFQYRCFKS